MTQYRAADYIAVRRLTNIDGEVVAAVGETCERVDPRSLPYLVADGDIVLKATQAAPERATADVPAIEAEAGAPDLPAPEADEPQPHRRERRSRHEEKE